MSLSSTDGQPGFEELVEDCWALLAEVEQSLIATSNNYSPPKSAAPFRERKTKKHCARSQDQLRQECIDTSGLGPNYSTCVPNYLADGSCLFDEYSPKPIVESTESQFCDTKTESQMTMASRPSTRFSSGITYETYLPLQDAKKLRKPIGRYRTDDDITLGTIAESTSLDHYTENEDAPSTSEESSTERTGSLGTHAEANHDLVDVIDDSAVCVWNVAADPVINKRNVLTQNPLPSVAPSPSTERMSSETSASSNTSVRLLQQNQVLERVHRRPTACAFLNQVKKRL
jgi:hypothetical protein